MAYLKEWLRRLFIKMWKRLKEIRTDDFPEGYEGGSKSIGEDCSDQNTKRAEIMGDWPPFSWHGRTQLLSAQQRGGGAGGGENKFSEHSLFLASSLSLVSPIGWAQLEAEDEGTWLVQPTEVSLLGLEHGGEEWTVVWRRKQIIQHRGEREQFHSI